MKFVYCFLLGVMLTSTQLAHSKQVPFITTIHENNQSTLDIDEKYFLISQVVVTEIKNDERAEGQKNVKSLGTVIASLNQLIAFGRNVWKIVEAGKPVTNVDLSARVSVLPKVKDVRSAFHDMEYWKGPKVKKFKVEYKNFYGMNVVSFTYSVSFDYDGKYQGKGHYLTGVGVEAENVNVSWGFEFNATNSVISITNRGSKEDPIASVNMKISYEAKSVLRTIKSTESFYITGKGKFKKL